MYWKTEQKCRQFTRYMSYFIYVDQLIPIAALFYSFYCIYAGSRDTSTWILAFNILVPFDTQNLFGWYLKWFICLTMSISYASAVTLITSYFVSCCLYIQAICNHFNMLNSLTEQNAESIRKNLTQAVNIHVTTFECVSNHLFLVRQHSNRSFEIFPNLLQCFSIDWRH